MIVENKGVDCKNIPYERVNIGASANLTNKKFNRLTALFRVKSSKAVYWLVKCECGNLLRIRSSHLTGLKIVSCGCTRKEHNKNFHDLTGLNFGYLTVLEFDKRVNHENFWKCKCCKCGNNTIVTTGNLTSGNTISCGCLKKSLKNDLIGRTFGSWTVIQRDLTKNKCYWICQCTCGAIKSVRSDGLLDGSTLSCGCRHISVGATQIKEILESSQIEYKCEVCFENLLSPLNGRLRYDYGIYKKGRLIRLIEFDGELHYQSRKDFGGQLGLKYRQQCDKIKDAYARLHKIPLVRIPFTINREIVLQDIVGDEYLITSQYEINKIG